MRPDGEADKDQRKVGVRNAIAAYGEPSLFHPFIGTILSSNSESACAHRSAVAFMDRSGMPAQTGMRRVAGGIERITVQSS
jgi:hypothetical protein